MRTRSKLLLAASVAALVLATSVASASAGRLSLNERVFSVDWAGLTFTAAPVSITCPLFLVGAFHSNTLHKVAGSLIGQVLAVTPIGSCTGGTITVLNETLPWHIRYRGFHGTLPAITGAAVDVVGASFRLDPDGILVPCLARSTAANPLSGIFSVVGGVLSTFGADPVAAIPISPAPCTGTVSPSGSGRVDGGEPGIDPVTIRLI